jgi:hypothetical protein
VLDASFREKWCRFLPSFCPESACIAALHPDQFVRRQNIRHDFRLRLRAEIVFTVETDAVQQLFQTSPLQRRSRLLEKWPGRHLQDKPEKETIG